MQKKYLSLLICTFFSQHVVASNFLHSDEDMLSDSSSFTSASSSEYEAPSSTINTFNFGQSENSFHLFNVSPNQAWYRHTITTGRDVLRSGEVAADTPAELQFQYQSESTFGQFLSFDLAMLPNSDVAWQMGVTATISVYLNDVCLERLTKLQDFTHYEINILPNTKNTLKIVYEHIHPEATPSYAAINHLTISSNLDSDHNGLDDPWEFKYFGVLGQQPDVDLDHDSLDNTQELFYGTNPQLADTDGDKIPDNIDMNHLGRLNAAANNEHKNQIGHALLQEGMAFLKNGRNLEAIKHIREAAEIFQYPPAQYQLALLHRAGKILPKSLRRYEELIKQAAQTDAQAQMHLASEAKDPRTRVKWLLAAKAQAEPTAYKPLADAYAQGRGVEKNEAKAIEYYQKAASANTDATSSAQYELAERYAAGRGVALDQTQATNWYVKSANNGYKLAYFPLGMRYASGTGIDINPTQARFWLEKAISQPAFKAEAAYALGELSLKDPADYALALSYYKTAARHHYQDACLVVGKILAFHSDVDQAIKRATEWWQQCLKHDQQGADRAKFHLANHLRAGDGIPKDAAQANAYYLELAEQGQEEAYLPASRAYQHHSAPSLYWYQRYAQTQAGQDPDVHNEIANYYKHEASDPEQAFTWFLSAANLGHLEASMEVAYHYFTGEGTPKDLDAALAWYKKAKIRHVGYTGKAAYFMGLIYYQKNQMEDALHWWNESLNEGYWAIYQKFASIYTHGIEGFISPDLKKAEAFYLKAVEQNNTAQLNAEIARFYAENTELPYHQAQSLYFWWRAAELGHQEAGTAISALLHTLKYDPEAAQKTFEWLDTQFEDDSLVDHTKILMEGYFYQEGIRVPQMREFAEELFETALKQGATIALYPLTVLKDRKPKNELDRFEVFGNYESVVNANNIFSAQAAYQIARFHEKAQSALSQPWNSISWHLKAVTSPFHLEPEHYDAYLKVATAYAQGNQVEKHPKLAIQWYVTWIEKLQLIPDTAEDVVANFEALKADTSTPFGRYMQAKRSPDAALAQAFYDTSQAYKNGILVQQDQHRAAILLQYAAHLNHAFAQFNIAIQQMPEDALAQLEQIETDDETLKVSIKYEKARRLEPDSPQAAMSLYKEASEYGHRRSFLKTMELYLQGYQLDQHKNYFKLINWYNQIYLTHFQDGKMAFELASFCEQIEQMNPSLILGQKENNIHFNDAISMFFLSIAEGMGYVDTTGTSATIYDKYVKSDVMARIMLKNADDIFDERSKHSVDFASLRWYYVGKFYTLGLGTKVNHEQAFASYLKAAEGGLPLAQLLVGEAYRIGRGVERDLEQSRMWFQTLTQNWMPNDTLTKLQKAKVLTWLDRALYDKRKPGALYLITQLMDVDYFFVRKPEHITTINLDAAEAGFYPAIGLAARAYEVGDYVEYDLDIAAEWHEKEQAIKASDKAIDYVRLLHFWKKMIKQAVH